MSRLRLVAVHLLHRRIDQAPRLLRAVEERQAARERIAHGKRQPIARMVQQRLVEAVADRPGSLLELVALAIELGVIAALVMGPSLGMHKVAEMDGEILAR